jgi:hypothetical protein
MCADEPNQEEAAAQNCRCSPDPLKGKKMPPDIPNPDDPVTPLLLKWVFLPLFGGSLLTVFGGVQINQWKCNTEATRQGYLQGDYIPPNRVGVGEACICEKKLRPDGTVDSSARLIIDLENRNLTW